jgi:Uma2 family endonuclease
VNEEHAMHGARNRVRMTYDDLLRLPDDGLRHELIDGEHFVTPAPSPKHQVVAANLHRLIAPYVYARRCGIALFAPFDVVFSKHDVVEPDLLYFSNARYAEVVTESNAQGGPDLAVEVLSPGTRRRDETLKRRLYERMNVPEYWSVDPDREIVKVFRLERSKYRLEELTLARSDALTTPLLPGLSIPLAAIFEMPV